MDVEVVNNHESLNEVVSCLILALDRVRLVRWRVPFPQMILSVRTTGVDIDWTEEILCGHQVRRPPLLPWLLGVSLKKACILGEVLSR
jgi:hypothetical protein